MKDGHDNFAKSWCSKYDDGWYLSLNLNQRGMWDQLYTWAKRCGDTGEISFRSWSHMGSVMGCDGKTCRKILGNFHADSKVVLKEDQQPGNFLTILIVNYIKNQYDKGNRKAESRGKVQKSPENSPITEQNRTEGVGSTPDRKGISLRVLAMQEYFQMQHDGYFAGLLGSGFTGWATENLIKPYLDPMYPKNHVSRSLERFMEHKMERNPGYRPLGQEGRGDVARWVKREYIDQPEGEELRDLSNPANL